MSKATIAKLTVLIFLAFIVCLPEFFPSEVLQVLFLCAPFEPCDPDSGHYDDQVYDNAGITRPRCEAQNAINQDEAVEHWFVCKTHTDLRSLRDNASNSEKDLEVIVMLQIAAPPLLQNVTVNGHVNRSGIYTETHHNITLFGICVQNESTQQNKDKTSKRSSSSTSGIFPAGSSERKNRNSSDHTHRSNITHCLARLENIQGMSSTTVKWWCVSTVVWLVLVLLVIVVVLLGVRDQVFKNKHCCKKKTVRPPAKQPQTFSKRRVKSLGDWPDNISELSIEDIEMFLEKTPADYSRGHVTTQRRASLVSTKRLLQVFQKSYKRGLSPIPELSATDVSLGENEDEYDEEAMSDGVTGVTGVTEEHQVCLDVPLTPANTHSEHHTFLHHRIHSSFE